MLTVRHAQERGHTQIDWLDSYHTFSFGHYQDPAQMGFRALRVINDDRVAPQAGFATHGHRDMEIVTYVLEGALEHKDSIGTGSVIRPGEIQRMSAGTGILHSEFNASATDPVHLLQIWILPAEQGLAPSYEQKPTGIQDQPGHLKLIAAADGRNGSVTVHQDIEIYAGLVPTGESIAYQVAPHRHAWIQVARGDLKLGNHSLQAGDGVAVTGSEAIQPLMLASDQGAEVLVFNLN